MTTRGIILHPHELQAGKELRQIWRPLSESDNTLYIACPYGDEGEVLFAKEGWQLVGFGMGSIGSIATVRYVSDAKEQRIKDNGEYAWDTNSLWEMKAPIHDAGDMPAVAARYWYDLCGVSVRRVQDITEEELMKVGGELRRCECTPDGQHECARCTECEASRTDRDWFIAVWNRIYGDRAWERNDFCWVLDIQKTDAK